MSPSKHEPVEARKTRASPATLENSLQGIALLCLTMFFVALTELLAKYLSQGFAVPQIVWARYVLLLVLALILFWPRYGPSLLRSRRPGLQWVRALLHLVANGGFFFALSHIGLAENAAIAFTIPIFIAALSVPLLGERVGPRRWAAVVAGFLGVLVVLRPGLGALHWAAGIALASSALAALFQIATRRIAAFDPAPVSLFYTGLVGTLGSSLLLPFFWRMPIGAEWLGLLSVGLVGGASQWLVLEAYRRGPAPVLAPFNYTQIVWSLLFGYLVFNHLPDFWTFAGAAVVIASGLYIVYREREAAVSLR